MVAADGTVGASHGLAGSSCLFRAFSIQAFLMGCAAAMVVYSLVASWTIASQFAVRLCVLHGCRSGPLIETRQGLRLS